MSTPEPTLYETGKKVVDDAVESVTTYINGEPPETEAHRQGREAAEAAKKSATEARDYVVNNATDAANAGNEYLTEVGESISKSVNETILAGQEYTAGVSSVIMPKDETNK